MTKKDTPESSLLSSSEEENDDHGIDVITGVSDNNQREKKHPSLSWNEIILLSWFTLFLNYDISVIQNVTEKEVKTTRSGLLKGKAYQIHPY